MLDTEVPGEPADVESAATWLRSTLAPGVDAAIDSMHAARRTGSAAWHGEAGEAFSAQLTRGAQPADELLTEVKDAARSCDGYAAALRRAQDRMAEIRQAASGAGLGVTGFVVARPSAGPPDPGPPPQDASPTTVDAYDASVREWNAHQEKVRAYNRAVTDAETVFEDHERACRQLENDYEGMSRMAAGLTSATIAGTAAIDAMDAKHTSILRKEAKGWADDLTRWREHMGSKNYNHRLGRQALDADYRHADDVAERARTAARNLDDVETRAKFSGASRALSRTLGAVGLGYGIYADLKAGESTEQAVTSNVGGVLAGAAAGAAVGTFIPIPVVGTVAGALVGAGVGLFTSGAIDSVFENGPDVGAAVDAGAEALSDTAGAIGDAGGAVVDTVGGWFD